MYAGYLALLAGEETVLQGMFGRLTDIGKCYGKDTNVDKNKVMRISRKPSQLQIITDQKQLKNVEYLKYLCSMVINVARCSSDIISSISMAKATFNKRRIFSLANRT